MNVEKLLSEKVKSLSESATLRMSQLATELKRSGKEVISLSLGEPDFDTPSHIKEAAKKALDDGYTKYTPVPGLHELREAISKKLKRDNQLDYNIDQIVVSNGAKQSIANLVAATINPGDEGILFAPYWVSYYDILQLTGGTPVCIKTSIADDYKVSPDQLKEAITEKTKFILFSSPCNPTGSVYSEAELRELAEVIEDTNILVISDEIYEYINFTEEHFSIGRIESIKEQVVTVNGFSKGFAMTGWRLGYMAGPTDIAKACSKIQGQDTSGANSFGQKAAITALNDSLDPTMKMCEAFEKRKNIVKNKLDAIPGIKANDPKGAFYFFADASELIGKKTSEGKLINNSSDLVEYFLKDAGVAMVEGSAFGLENHFRLSFATSEEQLIKALDKVKDSVERLS